MNKLIISIATVLCVGCAIALANVSDSNDTANSNNYMIPRTQEADSPLDHDTYEQVPQETPQNTAQNTKASKSCTDSGGVIYRPRDPGYQACAKAAKQGKTADQQAGIKAPAPSRAQAQTRNSLRVQ